ncbi:MAG: ATP-binding protein, partial [Desulfuromonadales bacterium]|nr:ATP-binding protein [Desulfuromonadales bacterium]
GELAKVYTKFFRAQTEKSAAGGLGLGMAIVKNIIEGHNGTIDIVSQRRVGTTVSITLPKRPLESEKST